MDKSHATVKVYDKIAKEYARAFDRDPSDLVYTDKFLSLLNQGGRVLDLACGTGRLARHMALKGFQVTGVDLSTEMIGIAKRKYPHINFIEEDIRKVEFERHHFNGVALAYGLFHLEPEDAVKLLGKINRLLSRNGVLFLALQEGKGEVMADEPLAPGEKIYLKLYKEKEIEALLIHAGFEVVFFERKKSQKKGELPYKKLIIFARKMAEVTSHTISK